MANYTPKEIRPDLPSYPVSTLETCDRFTRESFEKRFGEQSPPFRANDPDKTWFDTSENAGNYHRVTRDASGKPSIVPMTMTRELAASINLPGAYRYPRYVPEPTPATQEYTLGDGTQITQAYPAHLLSYEDDARALAIELGGTFEVTPASTRKPFDVHYAGDPRRVYQVVVGGQSYNVGQLLQQKCVNGIGAPGKWITTEEYLRWEPAAQPTAQLDPKVEPVPVPCRMLYADEEFRQGFNGWTIWKKETAATSAFEGFTQGDRDLLIRIAAKVGA